VLQIVPVPDGQRLLGRSGSTIDHRGRSGTPPISRIHRVDLKPISSFEQRGTLIIVQPKRFGEHVDEPRTWDSPVPRVARLEPVDVVLRTEHAISQLQPTEAAANSKPRQQLAKRVGPMIM
jgi:hypothetical protein